MKDKTRQACEYASKALAAAGDPEKAGPMAAYLKTDMPFYGVQMQPRKPIVRHLTKEFAPTSREEYEELVSALWELPHREEKWLAQGVAKAHREYLTPESLPLYKRMIVEGAWWDLVDEAATHMVRELIRDFPDETWPTVDSWIDDEDMWLRRTAIICQVGLKEQTDVDRLFRFCEKRMHEKEFFIRKAIGWALREYAWTNGPEVAEFATRHRDQLSGLSYREATKHIKDLIEG